MSAMRFIFCPHGAEIGLNEHHFAIPENHLAVTAEPVRISGETQHFDFYHADLQPLRYEFKNLLTPEPVLTKFSPLPVSIIHLGDKIMHLCINLAKANTSALLRFVYLYCVSQNKDYFSYFLAYLTTGNKQFYSFIESNFLQPWSVAQFAYQFGMPTRKFNAIFINRFGVSAKNWLFNRRLAHARQLLQTTSMRILDIALECGFSNHAHFTSSFHRCFAVTPREYRQQLALSLT
jgi:AraC-like DNA-binding protein